jgi:hypothetical protein
MLPDPMLPDPMRTDGMVTVPRPSSSLVAFWAVAVLGVLFVGDTIIRADWLGLALAIAPVALVVLASWMVLYRPRVSYDAVRVVVVNPLRSVSLPWQRVTSVRQRFQILIELDDGSTLTCWGSPFPEKPGRTRPDPSKRSFPGAEIVGPLEAARSRAAGRPVGTTGTSATTIHRPVVLLSGGSVLFVACVLEFALAR